MHMHMCMHMYAITQHSSSGIRDNNSPWTALAGKLSVEVLYGFKGVSTVPTLNKVSKF